MPRLTKRTRTPARSKSDADFLCGFAVAVAALARNGYPSMAVDIMKTNGVDIEDLRKAKVERFDLTPLVREWKQS